MFGLSLSKPGIQQQVIIGVTILLFGMISYYVYSTYALPLISKSTTANKEHNAVSGNSKKSVEIMFFYADWCPHCTKAKPHWTKLKESDLGHGAVLNGYTIYYTDVDCTDDKNSEMQEKLNKFKVEGFPTIKMVKGTEVIEFDAKPEYDTLTNFVKTTLTN